MKRICIALVLFCTFFKMFAEEGNIQDKRACEFAQKTATLEIWEAYLKEYPDGECRFEATLRIQELKRNSDAKPTNALQKNTEDLEVRYYHPHKSAGIALMVIGGTILLSVSPALIGYGVAADKDPVLYTGTGIAVGSVMIFLTGIGLLTQKEVIPKKNKKVALTHIGTMPTNDGIYASAGFNF